MSIVEYLDSDYIRTWWRSNLLRHWTRVLTTGRPIHTLPDISTYEAGADDDGTRVRRDTDPAG